MLPKEIMEPLQQTLQSALSELDPQFKALKNITNALKITTRLAADEKADALAMQKALAKLEATAAGISTPTLDAAIAAFADATQTALNNLSYDFAHDLREAFITRGETVAGRPPTLAVGPFIFKIEIAARKGQWFYGKEPLTRLIPLSLKGIVQHYDRQVKRLYNREFNAAAFLAELQKAWQDCIDKRLRRPAGMRINIMELYAQLVINRQTGRFWNAPARSTFKDYERELFVRDLVLLQQSGVSSLTINEQEQEIRLGVATKNHVEQSNRSIWLPTTALDGAYYSDIVFTNV